MNKKSLILVFVAFVIVACSSSLKKPDSTLISLPMTITETPPYIKTKEIIPNQSPIPSSTLSPTKTPMTTNFQTTMAITGNISPTIDKYCPDQPVVSFSELGLSDSTRLVLRDADVNHEENNVFIWTLSITQTQPVTLPNIVPGARIFSDQIIFSPNRKMLVYRGPGYKTWGDEWLYDFWISSFDGKQQWKLVSNIDAYTNPKWINNEEIEFWHTTKPLIICPKLEFTINPYTSVTKEAPKYPDLDGIYCAWPGWIINPDRTQILLPEDGNIYNSQWVVNDLNSGERLMVFPWLENIDLIEPSKLNIRWTESGFDFIFLQPYGFDFLLDLPISAVEERNVPWERYLLPREVLNYKLNWWSEDNRFFGFDIVDENVDQLKMAGEHIPSHLYLFDTNTKILRDYCLDRGHLGNIFGEAGMPKVTIDGRFMAWGIYEIPNIRFYPYEIVILDLETGHYVVLNMGTLDLVGWAEIPYIN